MINNLYEFAGILWRYSLPLVILAVYGFWVRTKNRDRSNQKVLIVAAVLLMLAIYSPTFLEPRYVVFLHIATIIGFCWYVGLAIKNNKYLGVVWFVCISSILISVFWQVDKLNSSINSGKIVRSDALYLSQVLSPGDRIASDRVDSIYACYYTKAKCYGVVTPSEKTKQELQSNDIKFLLIAESTVDRLKQFGVNLEQVENASYLNQKLYRVLSTPKL
jgi:hypothetical protein